MGLVQLKDLSDTSCLPYYAESFLLSQPQVWSVGGTTTVIDAELGVTFPTSPWVQSQAQDCFPAFPLHVESTIPGTITTTYSSPRLTIIGAHQTVSSPSLGIIKQGQQEVVSMAGFQYSLIRLKVLAAV